MHYMHDAYYAYYAFSTAPESGHLRFRPPVFEQFALPSTRSDLSQTSFRKKIRLRHEEVKRWRKRCRVKKIQPNVIDEIIKGSPRTPSQALSFINNARSIGFNPANFAPVLCNAVLNKNLQRLLLEEARALLRNAGRAHATPNDATDVCGRTAEGRYKICSRPYLPGVKEVAEIAHESLQNVVHKFERENCSKPDSKERVQLGAWFDKTTENDQPIRITIMYIGPKERAYISPNKDRFPFWGAAVLCLQENGTNESGITLQSRKFDRTWVLQDGDMMIITPKSVQTVVLTATNREAHALIIWF